MLSTSRADIAAALTTVTGVTGYEYRPAVVKPGDGWALIAGLNASEGYDYETTWRIYVVLSGDERTSMTSFETLAPDLIDALRSVVYVESISPVSLETEMGSTSALQVLARSE